MARLYKYVSPGTGRIILEQQSLRWSTPPLMNDPFDMQFAFQVRVDRAAVKAAALRKSWDAHYGQKKPSGALNELGQIIEIFRGMFPQLTREEFNREFGEAVDECIDKVLALRPAYASKIRQKFLNDKILCLSEVPDSVVMWAYYAQNHSGMVLCFRDAPGVDSPWQTARPVRYVDEVPSLFDDEYLSDMLSGKALDARRIMDAIVFTKSTHWAHEREWRIYSGAGRTREPHEDIPLNVMELDEVIFGCRMSGNERKCVSDLVHLRYPIAKLLQATTRDDIYALSIAPQ